MSAEDYWSIFSPLLERNGWTSGFYQQHFYDAYQAEFAGPETKPITLAFALAGLYLAVERGADGRRVQRAHGELAQRKELVPKVSYRHAEVGFGVEQAAADPSDDSLSRWCRSVWAGYLDQQQVVRVWVDAALDR